MDPLFVRLLKEKLALIRDMRVQQTTTTRLSPEDYLHNLGYLEALRHIDDVCEEIQDEMRKD